MAAYGHFLHFPPPPTLSRDNSPTGLSPRSRVGEEDLGLGETGHGLFGWDAKQLEQRGLVEGIERKIMEAER